MTVDPGALARLGVRIEEVLGVEDTAALLDPIARVRWDRLVTIDDLERSEMRLRELLERRLAQTQSQIRRDLLLVTGGQFFALVAAVAAVLGFS